MEGRGGAAKAVLTFKSHPRLLPLPAKRDILPSYLFKLGEMRCSQQGLDPRWRQA